MRLVPIERNGAVATAAEDPSGSVAGVLEQVGGLYARRGFAPPWICYLAEEQGTLVGTCGFAGPASQGEAEIAYFTFPGREGQGIGTRMAVALLEHCAPTAARQGLKLVAHTLPQEGASTRILRRLGFERVGTIAHPEDGTVWKWRITPGLGAPA